MAKKQEERLNIRRIVSELKAEIRRIDRALAALDETTAIRRRTTNEFEPPSNGAQAPRKRHHTAAVRKRLSVAMKKRWAEKRKKMLSGRK
jgi:hypothetical protein